MAEAALLISGVTDRGERQRYLAQLDEIAEQANAATANAQTPQAKARALGRFLLKGPMHAGYVSDEFNLRDLLESGHFNCLSSAVPFNMMARRIGLEVGAVVMPHHVFSRIPGFDVEPTAGKVYPADIRVERIMKHLADHHEEMGDSYSAQRPYHETSDFGVLAQIYYDDGCDQDQAKDYAAATISYLKTACLDPTNPSAGKNLKAALVNWFNA